MAKRRVIFVFVFLSISSIDASYSDNDSNDIARGFNARNMLEKIASTLMSRAGTSSQVLSLNITNLLILVLLKALIFAAGSLGAAGWKGHNSGHSSGHYRTADEEEGFFSDTEILLYLSYLSGSPGNQQCLQNIACHQPKQAEEYVKAGKMLLKTVHNIPNLVGSYTDYELTLVQLQEATEYGMKKGKCDMKYECSRKKAIQR